MSLGVTVTSRGDPVSAYGDPERSSLALADDLGDLIPLLDGVPVHVDNRVPGLHTGRLCGGIGLQRTDFRRQDGETDHVDDGEDQQGKQNVKDRSRGHDADPFEDRLFQKRPFFILLRITPPRAILREV